MKVLLLNQTFYPDQVATSQQTLDLALFLVERGYEVTVIAGRRSYEDPKIILPAREQHKGIDIVRVASSGFGKRNFLLRVVDGLSFEMMLLFKLLLFPSQDIVISFTSPPLIGVLGVLFCLVRGGRSIQWLMDVNPDAAIAVGYLKRGRPVARFLSWIFAFSLRHSDDIVVLDRWMKERVVGDGADPDRVAVIPPWPANELIPEPSPKQGVKFRKELGIHEKFVVLYSGNHSVVHPLETLLDAAVLLKDVPEVQFLFIGGGLRVRDVTAYVNKYRLRNVMQLSHQPRENLRETLFAANLHVVVMGEAVTGLVHTSKIYGILGTGKPYVFIGPRRSHVVDLQHECPYGFHVEHGQPEALVAVIEKARAFKPAVLATISQENIKFVTAHYAARKSMDLFSNQVLGSVAKDETKPLFSRSPG